MKSTRPRGFIAPTAAATEPPLLRPQLIFDLDDTLIRSFESYSLVHQQAAAALGLRVLSLDELVLYDSDFVSTLQRQYRDVPGFDPLLFIEVWDRIADAHPYRAIDGVQEALQSLLDANDLWIVTSRSQRRLGQRMAEGGLRPSWFRGVFAREDQPRQKPDPSCFEPVWRALGARPGDPALRTVVYVGDRETDRLAADSAEVTFVAVRTGPETRLGFPRDLPETHVVNTAAELPHWISRHGL